MTWLTTPRSRPGLAALTVTALVFAVGVSALAMLRTGWFVIVFGLLYLGLLWLHATVHLSVATGLLRAERTQGSLVIALISDVLLVVGALLQSGFADAPGNWLVISTLVHELVPDVPVSPPSWWPRGFDLLLLAPALLSYLWLRLASGGSMAKVPSTFSRAALSRSWALWVGLLGGTALVFGSILSFGFVVEYRQAERERPLVARAEAALRPPPGTDPNHAMPYTQASPVGLATCVGYWFTGPSQQIVDYYVSLLQSRGLQLYVSNQRTQAGLVVFNVYTTQGVQPPGLPAPQWDGRVRIYSWGDPKRIDSRLDTNEYGVCSTSFDDLRGVLNDSSIDG